MSCKDTALTSRGRIQWLLNKEDAANKHGTCETKHKREYTATRISICAPAIPASLQQTPQGVALLSPNWILIHFLSVSQGPGPAQPL
ncbi:rCG35653 [Rattus norvegicus]|uniref:RCG35653 n=1 Tax=Rattus norvegicus TaxID=10116 RepID=A6KF61_RAT|nr:rCG35653 [Rattus norvegicus]